jgi:hypothetical protein
MKNGFSIVNSLAAVLAVVSIGWLTFDFIVYDILRSKMLRLEPLTPADERLGMFIWIGLLVFLAFHILSFIAIATQFRRFRKASALRIIALILAIFSCIFILNDIGCLSDIGKEYAEGLEVEFEWKSLYASSVLHGIFFFTMLANLVEVFVSRKKERLNESVLKDEVVFTVVHCVGVFCGGAGLVGAFAVFIEKRAHAVLQFTFPFLFVLTLIPYALLSGYWLIMKLKDKPSDWYDEKQFQDISKAALLTMFATIPFLAFNYILNYGVPKGPIHILWFPLYLYFVIFVFSLSSLYFSWRQ